MLIVKTTSHSGVASKHSPSSFDLSRDLLSSDIIGPRLLNANAIASTGLLSHILTAGNALVPTAFVIAILAYKCCL